MDNINKLNVLNIYILLKKFVSSIKSSRDKSSYVSEINEKIIKPISDIFSSITNESFVIVKIEESSNKQYYFKYLINSISSNANFDIIETSQEIEDKNILTIKFNKFNLFFNLDSGNTFTVISQNNLDYESLSLIESMKLTGILSKKYISKISCGDTHALFLTQNGTIFSIGDNTFGQLGIGENQKIPQTGEALMIPDLLNFKIIDIFAGNDHSMCFGELRELSKNSNMSTSVISHKILQYLFVWGDNSHGQLGLKLKKTENNDNNININEIVLKPTKLSLNENEHSYAITDDSLVNLTGGLFFSAVLLSSGRLFTFGDNQYNQIIILNNSEKPCLMSKHIPKEYGKIIKVITSANSCLLITDNKKILVFGKFNSPLLDHVLIVDLLNYDEKMKFIFTDSKLKYVTFDEAVKNPKIFGNVMKEKIENLIDKAYNDSLIKRKFITRKSLGSNSTLSYKTDMSFNGNEKSKYGFDLDLSREESNNSLMIPKGRSNIEIKISFNDYINKLNNNIDMNKVNIETNEKNYYNDYDNKIKEFLKHSQKDLEQIQNEFRNKDISKKKETNILYNSLNDKTNKKDLKEKSNNTNKIINKDRYSLQNIINSKENEMKNKNNFNVNEKERVKDNYNCIKRDNNQNNIKNNIQNQNKGKEKEIIENKDKGGEIKLSDLLEIEEEDNNTKENYPINNNEKENNKKNKRNKIEINIKNINNRIITNDSDEEDNNSFSIFKHNDSDKDIKFNTITNEKTNRIFRTKDKTYEQKGNLPPPKSIFNTIDNNSINRTFKVNKKNIQNKNINFNKNNIYSSNTYNYRKNNNLSKSLNQTVNNNQQSIIEEIRELGQFLSKEFNKYSKQRIDAKKELFFHQLISSYYNSKITNLSRNVLVNNIISGIPNHFRGRFWFKFIENKKLITPKDFKYNLDFYEKNYKNKAKSIKYILPFSYLGIFKENNPLANDLNQVLNAFIVAESSIPYTENISYLLGVLLINMDRYQAYQCLINIINNKNRIIYYENQEKNNNYILENIETPTGEEPNIVKINLRRVIFKQLIFFNLPELCSHLELLNILPENYFDEWSATMFSKNFNIDIVMKIWDLYIVLGEKIIFNAGVLFLKELEEDLYDCEEKEEAMDILLNSQEKEINESHILNNILKVKCPEWIQSELDLINQEGVSVFKFK